MKTYRLSSAEMINAPGMVRWAINGAHFKKDRPQMIEIIRRGWNVPVDAATKLVTGAVPYTVEGDVVVFSA